MFSRPVSRSSIAANCPVSPRSASTEPVGTSTLTSSSARVLPNDLLTPRTSMAGVSPLTGRRERAERKSTTASSQLLSASRHSHFVAFRAFVGIHVPRAEPFDQLLAELDASGADLKTIDPA